MLHVVMREGRSEDFGSAPELLNRVWPHRVGSERGLRHAAAVPPPSAHRRYWAAEDGGKLVGSEFRKCGLGSALLERCEAHLVGLGVATALSFASSGAT